MALIVPDRLRLEALAEKLEIKVLKNLNHRVGIIFYFIILENQLLLVNFGLLKGPFTYLGNFKVN